MNKLLISTMLNVIYFDGQDYHIIDSGKLEEGNAHYMGITWNDVVFIVSGCSNTKYGYYTYTKDFHKLGFFGKLDLHETHQIFYRENKIYFVNTGLNRIEWTDIYEDVEISHHKSFNESTCDVDHLNSIWADNECFYIAEFRHKSEEPSAVRICDLDLNLLATIEIGLPIHNVYVENNEMFNLVSRKAGIQITYLKDLSQYFMPLPLLQGMLIRGLARTEFNWYVGASRWEEDRSKRHVGDGIISVLDNNFREVHRILMPDVGPICDIRVIDELDLAHNGIPY